MWYPGLRHFDFVVALLLRPSAPLAAVVDHRPQQVLMHLDHTIGELVDYLETEGWMENSIIVVASDNGGCLNNGGSNYPLRGTKVTYWEGGQKVTNSRAARSIGADRSFAMLLKYPRPVLPGRCSFPAYSTLF